MTVTKFNQPTMVGVGAQLGNHAVLLYWYRPKSRPFLTYRNQKTNQWWRI